MREIKFRAWLPGISKMTYSHTLEELMNWDTKKEDNGTAIWLQYTGLKDKNGKEIYDNDIFKAPHDFGPGGFDVRQAVVRWHEIKGYQWEYWLLDQLEVIGNIYENPELLEVTP